MRPFQRNSIAVSIAALTLLAGAPAWGQAIPDPEDPLGEVDPLGDYDLLYGEDDPLRGPIEGDEQVVLDEDAGGQDADPYADPSIDVLEIGPDPYAARRQPGRDRDARRAEGAAGVTSDFVRGRPRDELEPLGLRAGSFIVYPEVETAVEATDNVFSSSDGRESDVLFVARPRVTARSDWSRHEVALGYEGEYGVYAEHRSENPDRTRLTASGRLDVTSRTALAADGYFAIQQEGRSDPDAVAGAVSPTMFRSYGATAEASQRFNRLTVALRGGIDVEDYDDDRDATGAVIDNSDRDFTDMTAGGRLTYAVSPATEVFGDVAYRERDYDLPVDDAGFARDSERVTVTTGVSIEPTPLTRASASIGFVRETFEDARLATIEDVVGEASLAWAVTPLTTVNAGFSATVDATTVAGASGEVSRTVTAGVDHELLRNLILGAAGSYEWLDYPGAALGEETVTASLSAEYWFNRFAALTAGYRHETEMPDDGSGDTSENVVSVGLRLRR